MNKFSIFEKIISLFYREAFSLKELKTLHPAQKHSEDFIFSLYDYSQKKVKKIIKYLKNKNDFLLKKKIADEMSKYLQDFLAEKKLFSEYTKPLVLPVPMTRFDKLKRGFNQTEILAYYLAKNIKGEYNKKVLLKNIKTKKQALIKNKKERFINIKNAFSIKKGKEDILKNTDIIIIDDLSTTGATLLEIKKILKKAGARNVTAITIAH